MLPHLRYTIRVLLKTPGFTIMTILILGLGIGANTAIFSLINGVLFKPLPYPNADRLVRLYQPTQEITQMSMAYSDYFDFRANQHSLQNLAIFFADEFHRTGNGDPERIDGAYVTGGFFNVMGRPFVLGRPLGETDDGAAANVVVLSERLWRTRFSADPQIIGKSIQLSGRSFQVVGVTPEQAGEIRNLDLYLPFSLNPRYADVKSRRSGHMHSCVGRLKEGVSLQQAQAEFEVINKDLMTRYPATNADFGIRLVPFLDSVVSDYSATLWLLSGAVACLLVITCANIANLLLARASERQKEITIRAALGASRKRLAVQLLFESLLLGSLGGAAGLLASYWAVTWIRQLAPEHITRLHLINIDSTALIFVLILTLLTTLLFGLLPAFVVSRTNLGSALHDAVGRTGTGGPERQRSQNILVIGQVALAAVLLIGAGLLARSFAALQNTPLGFDARHVLTADIYLGDSKYGEDEHRKEVFDTLLDRAGHLPGVTAVGLNDTPPFCETDFESLSIVGHPMSRNSELPYMVRQIVSPDYFRTLGIRLLSGRFFDERDQPNKENVVIINESIAQRFFPGEDPIGKQTDDIGDRFGKQRHYYTIVGVVANVQHDDPQYQETPFQTYYPYTQPASNFGTLKFRHAGVADKRRSPSHYPGSSEDGGRDRPGVTALQSTYL
jgi:putative ABC transport system permease protein